MFGSCLALRVIDGGELVHEARRWLGASESGGTESLQRGFHLGDGTGIIQRDAQCREAGRSTRWIAQALDLHVINPQHRLGSDAVALHGFLAFASAFLVVVPRAFFADEERAVAAVGNRFGEREGHLDDLRLLHRAGDLEGGPHHAVARVHAHFKELLLRPRVFCGGEAHAEDIVAARPVARHRELQKAQRHHGGMHGRRAEIGTLVKVRAAEVVFVILLPVFAECTVRLVRVVLGRLEAKGLR